MEKLRLRSAMIAIMACALASAATSQAWDSGSAGGLMSAIPRPSRLKLFNRSVAAAMDPAFREIYGDFFKKNSVDALGVVRLILPNKFSQGQTRASPGGPSERAEAMASYVIEK